MNVCLFYFWVIFFSLNCNSFLLSNLDSKTSPQFRRSSKFNSSKATIIAYQSIISNPNLSNQTINHTYNDYSISTENKSTNRHILSVPQNQTQIDMINDYLILNDKQITHYYLNAPNLVDFIYINKSTNSTRKRISRLHAPRTRIGPPIVLLGLIIAVTTLVSVLIVACKAVQEASEERRGSVF